MTMMYKYQYEDNSLTKISSTNLQDISPDIPIEKLKVYGNNQGRVTAAWVFTTTSYPADAMFAFLEYCVRHLPPGVYELVHATESRALAFGEALEKFIWSTKHKAWYREGTDPESCKRIVWATPEKPATFEVYGVTIALYEFTTRKLTMNVDAEMSELNDTQARALANWLNIVAAWMCGNVAQVRPPDSVRYSRVHPST